MLLYLLACATPCPSDQKEVDGACVPADTAADDTSGDDTGGTGDSADADTDTDADSDTDTDTDTDTAVVEDPCSLTGVTAAAVVDGPVNNQRVHVTLDNPGSVTVTCSLDEGPPAPSTLFAAGSTWAYDDDATVTPGWSATSFDDGRWSTGPAPLGYGESVATEIGYGGDDNAKYTTSWYRAHVDVPDAAALSTVHLAVSYDDGAVVYLNGVEVGRFNMPTGTITSSTLASASIEATTETVDLPAADFVTGDNVLAVEVHQSGPTSSDVWFDLALTTDGARAGDPDERIVVTSPHATDHDIPVRGLLADAAYTCSVAPSCGDAGEVSLTTAPLPADMPSLTPSGAPPTGGYVLFNLQRPCTGSSQQYFIIADPEGRIRWYDAADGVTASDSMDIEVALLPDHERILWGGGEDPSADPQLVDLDGTTVYTATYEGSGDDVYNHDVEWTPSDSIIGLVGTRTRTSGRAISGFQLLEHDPVTSDILFDWDSQTAYDAGQLDAGAGSDPWHANALANVVDALGAGVYVNLYGSGQVVRIDKASGDISFILGRGQDVTLQDASGHPLGDEGWFDAAHGMGIFDGDKLVQYDNGVTTGVSRIVEYQLDPVAQTARLLFEWNEGYYNPNWGDVDLLSDGNFLVDEPATWCTGGQDSAGSILMVDRSDSSVPWRLRFTDRDDSSYRAQWVDGCDLFGNSKYCG